MKTNKIDWLMSAARWCFAEGDAPPASSGSTLYPTPAADPAPAPEPAPDPALAPALAADSKPGTALEGDPAPAADATPAADPAPAPAPETLTPESYGTFELPEGFTEDPESMTAVKALFVEGQVPKELAQKMVTFHAEQMKAAVAAGVEASRKVFEATQTEWVEKINVMPEFQGEAKKQTSAMLGRMMDEYGSTEARQAFALTGAGNNPAIVQMFLKMAKALSEGGPTPPGNPAGQRQQQSRGSKLYGSKN